MREDNFFGNDRLLETFLREDIGKGDITSMLLFSPGERGRARIVAREKLVLSGGPFAGRVFLLLDPETAVAIKAVEGQELEAGETIMELEGRLLVLLAGERVALNLLQRLSGISTLTREFSRLLEGQKTRLLDTRKTTPGIRILEKYAVRMGGGRNHRFGLDDGILIKTNHIRAAGGVEEAFRRARDSAPHYLQIEIEVCSLSELEEAAKAGANLVLLDNMSQPDIREAVNRYGERIKLEVSGGVSRENIRSLSETGVDYISAGAIIHTARWVNLAMKVEPL